MPKLNLDSIGSQAHGYEPHESIRCSTLVSTEWQHHEARGRWDGGDYMPLVTLHDDGTPRELKSRQVSRSWGCDF